MSAADDDLKFTLDEAAHELSDAVLEVEDWAPWLVYFLEDLEMLAASLDSKHPKGYRALLERLRDDIEAKLKKGTREEPLFLASPIRRDYWS